MRIEAVILIAALAATPLGARGADLVVWWEQGWYPEEERAVAEMVAAFEAQSGVKVELVSIGSAHQAEVQEALEGGHPPDFLWGFGGPRGMLSSGLTRIGS